MENYLETNKATWNKKVDVHMKSDFYFLEEFIQGRSSLNPVELGLLGNIDGKKILHLQCHFGQDSISLSRLGAKVTGVDLSDKAIQEAQKLAVKCNTDTQFIASDVYNLPQVLDEKFDIVYTSYGTIGWLPDLEKWSKVISGFLNPGGRLVFVEFHPMVWIWDNDFDKIIYSYFKDQAIIENYEGTYADKSAEITQTDITWNHSLDEVIQNILKQNLQLDSFQEFNYSPYQCLNGMVETEKGKYIIEKFGDKVPLVYAISATKKDDQ